MNNLMQLLSDAEKAKVDLQVISSIVSQIKLAAGQTNRFENDDGYQLISKLAMSLPNNKPGYVYSEIAASLDAFIGGVTGKKVLDVGCDYTGQLIKAIAGHYKDTEVVGINPALENISFSNNCRIENADIRSTAFPDNYFDCIVSISAFEHIHELKKALEEMFRILKPGGVLFSRFGPIWSSSFGHHMWFTHRGNVYNYWNTFLPPFCHLMMTPKELFDFCTPLYGEDAALKIVEYIFHTKEQNRLLFNDYKKLIAQNSFETLFFTGYISPVLSRLYVPTNWPQTLETLHLRYPQNDNFKYDGIELLLKKPQTQH